VKNLITFLLLLLIAVNIYSEDNINITNVSNEKTSKMINLGFFYMFPSSEFEEPYSEGREGDKLYYRMPANSWNDSFYIILNFDWDFIQKINLRIGWGLEFNFGGSGDSEGAADKVKIDTDLAKAKGGEFYANFVSHKVMSYLNFIFYPYSIEFIDFYTGIGSGIGIGWFTYNELVDKEVSEYEQNYRDTFVRLLYCLKFFGGIVLHISDTFEPLFVETSFKLANEPILKHTTGFDRYIKFQISGWMLGIGVRY